MTTDTTLLNIDLAVGTAAAVAMGMFAVPNIDRIRTFWRVVTRRPARRVRERRLVAGGLSTS